MSARRRSLRSCAKGCGSTAGGRLRRANQPTHIRPYGAPSPNGRRNLSADNPPIASISRADNPLIPMTFQDKQRHEPSALSPTPDSWPSRRWGGRRIQRPDVGGLWSSDEARGMDTPGVLMEVDGWPPFARRALPVRAADESHVRRAPSAAMSAAVIRSGPNSGPLPGRRAENGRAGQVCFVETVTLQQHRARPGRPAPSPTFPAAMPESEDAWMEGGWWLVAGGQWPVASG